MSIQSRAYATFARFNRPLRRRLGGGELHGSRGWILYARRVRSSMFVNHSNSGGTARDDSTSAGEDRCHACGNSWECYGGTGVRFAYPSLEGALWSKESKKRHCT